MVMGDPAALARIRKPGVARGGLLASSNLVPTPCGPSYTTLAYDAATRDLELPAQRRRNRSGHRGAGRTDRLAVHPPHAGAGPWCRTGLRPGGRHGGCRLWMRGGIRPDGHLELSDDPNHLAAPRRRRVPVLPGRVDLPACVGSTSAAGQRRRSRVRLSVHLAVDARQPDDDPFV